MKSLHKVLKPEQIVTNSIKIGIYQEPEQPEGTPVSGGGAENDVDESKTYYALISEEKRKILEHARDQAGQSAARILEEAYAQRDKIVNMASEESVRMKEQAYKEGYEKGLMQADQDIRESFSSMEQSIAQMEQNLAEYEGETEQKMVELSLYMMEKILKRHMKEDETVLADMAEAAILSERDKNSVIAHLSDATMGLIKSLEERLKPLMGNNRQFGTMKLRADHIPPGTVQIETEEGIVDASVDVQIANLKKQLAAFGSQPSMEL